MALALSQSEAEQKEKERRNRPHIAPDTSLHPTGMINLSFFHYLIKYSLDNKCMLFFYFLSIPNAVVGERVARTHHYRQHGALPLSRQELLGAEVVP